MMREYNEYDEYLLMFNKPYDLRVDKRGAHKSVTENCAPTSTDFLKWNIKRRKQNFLQKETPAYLDPRNWN